MKRFIASASTVAILTMVLLPVSAQQVPVTGQMMAIGVTAPVVPTATSPTAAADETHARYTAAPAGNAAPVATNTRAENAPRQIASSTPRSHGTEVGETTRSLLQMQADDSRPGTPLPMLGAEASASYARYLKSFSHDIPEFYETRVGKDSSSGSSSGSGAQ